MFNYFQISPHEKRGEFSGDFVNNLPGRFVLQLEFFTASDKLRNGNLC
jgi:hypothetical protein